jgi:hypothetical protein
MERIERGRFCNQREVNMTRVREITIVGTSSRAAAGLAAVLMATLLGSGSAVASIVSVNAGTNGTTGWSFANTSVNSSQNGAFTGASGTTAMGTSWGLYANSSQTASQTYSFASALNTAIGVSTLPVGGTVRIDLSIGFLNSGATVGIGLQNSSGVNRFETYYIGSHASDTFKLNDAGGQENITGPNTSFGASSWKASPAQFQTILFTQLAGNQYSLSFDGVAVTNSGLTLTASDISQIRFFNFNAGSGGDFNQYANNLVVVPEPGTMAGGVMGLVAVALMARWGRSGPPGASIRRTD